LIDVTAAELHEATETERIERWRLEELVRAGYPAEGAALLAPRLDIDLHEAVALLERGCTADIALRILL